MPFLPPNQQRQSTEGTEINNESLSLNPKPQSFYVNVIPHLVAPKQALRLVPGLYDYCHDDFLVDKSLIYLNQLCEHDLYGLLVPATA